MMSSEKELDVCFFFFFYAMGKTHCQQPPKGGAQHVLMLNGLTGVPRKKPPKHVENSCPALGNNETEL